MKGFMIFIVTSLPVSLKVFFLLVAPTGFCDLISPE